MYMQQHFVYVEFRLLQNSGPKKNVNFTMDHYKVFRRIVYTAPGSEQLLDLPWS